MNLTKADFMNSPKNDKQEYMLKLTEVEIDRVLVAQENAEMFEYGEKHSVENTKIVERLKKLVKNFEPDGYESTYELVKELQKILGEGKC